jgi:hypothetical protein
METHELFDLEAKQFAPAKAISVRVPNAKRQKLEYIASQNRWQLSQMVNKMIDLYLDQYDKLPKSKQSKFDFSG